MIKVRKKKKINQFFVKRIKEELYELDNKIIKEIKIVKEKANSNGTLTSGETIQSITSVITENIISSCQEMLNFIDDFQEYMKFKIIDNHLKEIGEIFKTHYIPLLERHFDNTLPNENKLIFKGFYDPIFDNYSKNVTLKRVELIISNKIENVQLKNSLKKDEPSVRLARVSISISFFLMLISFLNIILSFYLNFFKDK